MVEFEALYKELFLLSLKTLDCNESKLKAKVHNAQSSCGKNRKANQFIQSTSLNAGL